MSQNERVWTQPVTVIVRVWDSGDAEAALSGEIEHVRTGQRRPFRSYATLLALLEQWRLDGAEGQR